MKHLAKHIRKSGITVLTFVLLVGCSPLDTFTSEAISSATQSDSLVEVSDISHDGQFTLIANSSSVCLWNNITQKLQLECLVGKAKDYIEIVKIAKSNQYFITSNRVSVRLYSLISGKLIGEWSLQDHIINDISLSKNADVILLGFRSGKASVINPFTKAMATYQKHKLDINSVSISNDGLFAFSGSSDKTAKYWNTVTGEDIHVFTHLSRVNHLVMSGDKTIGFSIDAIKDRKIWDLSTGNLIAELDSHLRFMEFNDTKFSSDKSLMLSGSPKQTIQLWRLSDGRLIAQWEAKKLKKRSSVLSIAFKENQVLSTTSDGILETWTMPSTSVLTTE
jgi:WD40 repeat protein